MAAAHGRVQHLEIEHGRGRVQRAQLGQPLGLGPAVAPERRGPLLEGPQPLLGQRLQGALHDQVDQLLGRVEAAAVLAGVGVGADGDRARAVAHRLPLQQPLVDRAELLDGHVAVVDEAPPLARLGMAEVVDDRGHDRVRQADPVQQRSGVGGEEAAVVGRQADGGVAPIDQPAERRQVVAVVAGGGGEGVALVHAAGDVVAHPLAQPVVVVAGVVDGEQAPVLGVEQEEQPVEEDQRRLARLREIRPLRVREGLHELGEDPLEDHAGEVLRDLLLVAPSLGQGRLDERAALARDERLAAEEQVEGAQGVRIVGLEDRFQIGFEVAAGAGPGAVVVEPPDAAVAEDAPAQPSVRDRLRRRQVAQDLAVGRAPLHGVVRVAAVERQAGALALLDQQRVPEALL